MIYRVTFASGLQAEVESSLPLIEFARGYPLTADIQVLPVETAPEPVVEEAPAAKPAAKRKKVQDAE